MTVSLTAERAQKIIDLCLQALGADKISIRQLAEIVGTCIAAEPGVDFAPVFYRRADIFKAECLKKSHGNFEKNVVLTDNVKTDLTLHHPQNTLNSFVI